MAIAVTDGRETSRGSVYLFGYVIEMERGRGVVLRQQTGPDPVAEPWMAKSGSTDRSKLVAELAPALRDNAVIPGIVVKNQPVPGSRYRHLTVVWDKWASVPQVDRGKIILDAFEQGLGSEEKWRVLEVTLAVGLTTSEAHKLKIA